MAFTVNKWHSSMLHCFVSMSTRFGNCTVVGLNGTLVEAKICTDLGHLNVRILVLTSFLFRPTTVQMENLALTETKRITVWGRLNTKYVTLKTFRNTIRLTSCVGNFSPAMGLGTKYA